MASNGGVVRDVSLERVVYDRLVDDVESGPQAEIMGEKMIINDHQWHYVALFPLLTKDNEQEYKEKMVDSVERAQGFFTKRAWESSEADQKAGIKPIKDLFHEGMTKHEFHDVVREAMVGILGGPKMGFKLGTEISIDQDEILLLMELPNSQEPTSALMQIASRQEVRMQVREELYEPMGVQCPTLTYDRHQKKFIGQEPTEMCPMVLPFKKHHAHKFRNFKDIDIMRIMRNRMREFLNLNAMIRAGILIDVFPVHRYEKVEKLNETGWSKMNIFPLVSYRDPRDQKVRNYFGEEVAFFFHWYNFYTYYLTGPAIVAFFLIVWSQVYPENFQLIRMGFAFCMCIWSAVFVRMYNQRSNLRIEQWGMRNWELKATVRPSYNEAKDDTWAEFFQNSFHWVLVVLFMAQTIVMVAGISWMRATALDDPEAVWNLILFTAQGKMVAQFGKYLITVNIKVIDSLWLHISPTLTQKENWRTGQEMKNQGVTKLFVVKFAVNYYPFLYTAFLKRYVENVTPAECIDELRENLLTFFLSHVALEIFQVILSIVTTRRAIRNEIQKVREHKPEAKYTYLQFQAKCPKYKDDTEDMMELIISLGFVMMFSSVAPSMVFINWLGNLCTYRLAAYRMANIMRRAEPMGQEGIGSWGPIVMAVSLFGVISNVAIAVFEFPPFDEYSWRMQLSLFIIIEHATLGMTALAGIVIPDKDRTLKRIQALNTEYMDEIFDYSFQQGVTVGKEYSHSRKSIANISESVKVSEQELFRRPSLILRTAVSPREA